MRLYNRLAPRILAASSLLGLLGTLGTSYLATFMGVDTALPRSTRFATALIQSTHREECVGFSLEFSSNMPRGLRVVIEGPQS
ncbi:hypothetical protein HJC22_00475 [Corallococcus exiguus]|uniref:hypothetical protein n=1 Tax=Corallococcus exiguus TaxID=83462 RepID=UPI0014726750|nr:hypothetical protein [Corallococcus exiguus]NNC14204.1 hypothetical protein [Corallococcus exiguus]